MLDVFFLFLFKITCFPLMMIYVSAYLLFIRWLEDSYLCLWYAMAWTIKSLDLFLWIASILPRVYLVILPPKFVDSICLFLQKLNYLLFFFRPSWHKIMFSRPIRWILALHGDNVVPFTYAGVLRWILALSCKNL